MGEDTGKTRSAAYEEVLRQAVVYPPIMVYDDPFEGRLGVYRLNGGKVRTLPVADVERKRRELIILMREQSEKQ